MRRATLEGLYGTTRPGINGDHFFAILNVLHVTLVKEGVVIVVLSLSLLVYELKTKLPSASREGETPLLSTKSIAENQHVT